MSEDYLKTARVLIVDDQPQEAVPIMTALGKLGIGCIFRRGVNIEDLPKEPYEGIRLVFLDLQLDQGGDPKGFLPKTLNVLKSLVDPQTMPLLVICWTKHKEDFDEFRRMAVKDIPGLRPGFIEKMPKPKGDPENWGELFPEIKNIIEKFPAVQIIWDWEQVSHDAVSHTTQTLADIVTEDFEDNTNGMQEKWIEGLLKVFRSLVLAESGKNVDKSSAPSAFFNVMNALVTDKINHTIFNKEIPYSEVLLPHNNESPTITQKARLNQMIQVEQVHHENISINPGNIYLPEEILEDNCVHRICNLEFRKIADEIISISKKDPLKMEYKKEQGDVITRIRKNPDDQELKEKQESIQKKIGDIPDTIRDRCKSILVEISPICDFSQKKRPVARFIGGILIPEKHKESISRREEYLYKFDPLSFPGLEGAWVPVLNYRYQFGVADPESLIKNKSIFRLRSQTLVDLQVKAASYSARPGILSIR